MAVNPLAERMLTKLYRRWPGATSVNTDRGLLSELHELAHYVDLNRRIPTRNMDAVTFRVAAQLDDDTYPALVRAEAVALYAVKAALRGEGSLREAQRWVYLAAQDSIVRGYEYWENQTTKSSHQRAQEATRWLKAEVQCAEFTQRGRRTAKIMTALVAELKAER